jgi:LPS-assembly protein
MTRAAGVRTPWLRWRRSAGRALACVLLMAAAALATDPAFAQYYVSFPALPPPAPAPVNKGPNDQMLVQSQQLHYDYANQTVSAIGNVQIYFAHNTIEADRVIYNQKTKRLHAEGNVRLTEADGKVTYGEVMDLSDDYRDGFVDALRLDAPDRTRFAAATGERSSGNYEVFQNGVYTACEACKDDPKRPPVWQVKAARIIHDDSEKMIYFEDARIEFSGIPLAYMPYMSSPDPTVKRKSGFLMPSVATSASYGFALEIPYFWALAPDYDLTLAPRITTRQGPLMQLEWRQRLLDGSYSIRGGGIYQLDQTAFTNQPGDRPWRGTIESSGMFNLSQKWAWGWDLVAPTDRAFYQDYGIFRFSPSLDLLKTSPTEGISQLFLTGRGDRSYFDARSIYFYGFSAADQQGQIPNIHPVVDYTHTVATPILGGEVSYKGNLTSLDRAQESLDPVSLNAQTMGFCGPATADSAALTPANCLLRGFPGSYTRFSGEAQWRRTFTDPIGEQFTPFAMVSADAADLHVLNQPGVSNYLPVGDTTPTRAMPGVGVEYRYPFISVQSWGTQTIQPIAQVIARPNETGIGRFPIEDAQSLVFDDSNLFRVDKFTGWDRIEGGGRANVGVQYTAQFNQAGFVDALFGQSYQLFGLNSFAAQDPTNTGLQSGLDTNVSDYVGRISYQPDRTYTFTTRARFDHDTFAVQRFEVEGKANFDRWSLQLLYGDYAPQPDLGLLQRREGIFGLANVKVTGNWAVFGGGRYDIENQKFAGTQVGVGYVDDCLILALNYISSYSYSSAPTVINNSVMLQLSLRTLGTTGISQTVGGSGGTTGSSSAFGGTNPFFH